MTTSEFTPEQQEILDQARDELAKQMDDLLDGIPPMTMKEIGYAALKAYYGIEREQVFAMETTFDAGTLYVNTKILLQTPIEYITLNLGGIS